MKYFWSLFAILLLCINNADGQTPTDASIPDANHVLVVYNSLDQTSVDVKDYYQNARGIPSSNIVPLDSLVNKEITIDSETHVVGLAQETDIIRDFYQDAIWAVTPTKHAFRYFLDNISTPIRDWITSHNLTSTIRYIVLCKGVPFKIQSGGDWCCFVEGNLTVDGLLCMLNTPDYDSYLLNTVLYNNRLLNPYCNVDPFFSMEYRFLPDHFNGSVYKLSYLVSHLDGISYDVVKGIIDRSMEPDMSGTAAWVIDDDPTFPGSSLHNIFTKSKTKLEELGFNVVYNNNDDWITSHTGDIMGYTSWGTHAEDGNCEWEDSAWVKDYLNFNLANGSVFNTFESFNGNSLTTLNWRYVPNDPLSNCNHTQGLATQFTEIGGTGTMGHAWEPGGDGVDSTQIFFPAYQMGYSLVDAYYQGLPFLAWQNVLVGDPLVRIYECENTVISTNTTIGSGDYQCNITVPQNVVLTIASGSTINFNRNTSLKVYGTLEVSSNVTLNFNAYSKLIVDDSGTLSTSTGSHFNFNDHSKFILYNNFELTIEDNFVFNSESEFRVEGILTMGLNSNVTFNFNSILRVLNTININPGVVMTFNYNSKLRVPGSFHCIGEPLNKVTLTFSSSGLDQFYLENGKSLELDYTTINNGSIHFTGNELEYLSITNTLFNDTHWFAAVFLNLLNADLQQDPVIANCVFNNSAVPNLYLNQVRKINLEHNSFNLITTNANAVNIFNCGTVNISDCNFSGGSRGINCQPSLTADGIEFNENIIPDLNINQCVFNTQTGIEIARASSTAYVNINGNHFEDCNIGISIYNAFNYSPFITNNIVAGRVSNFEFPSQFGITISGGNQVFILDNSITNFLTGISLVNVNEGIIKENNISAIDLSEEPLSGIVAVSSNGQIRKNIIQHHRNGIELGSSSPKIGANTIIANDYYGIYISSDSHPDLSESFVGEENYPISGYNTIKENGLCNQINYSELYLVKSTVNLEKGCNTIADDREEPLNCGYLYLIDGKGVRKEINAIRNYWGEVNGSNPEGRFGGGIIVHYGDWQDEPCVYGESGTELILADSKGVVYDTIYSTGITASGLTDIETRYAAANNYYYNNQFNQANQEYQGIIQNYENTKESMQAYNRLYTIANLTNSTPAEFNQLKDFYMQKASNQTDSVMIGTLIHLSDLCLVSSEEYITAINKFDEIVQQNPNTDLALYRQIDALTTSLLIPQDSSLNKGVLGKYSVNSLSEYSNKLSELLKTRGKSGLESEEELFPIEYTLYQNYPNPFNPTTTIKYDLPSTSEVSLGIYDILGRKVKELVSEKQQAGRYEVQFNASNLASGVYIYQLITEKYLSSKKMILLK